VTFDELRKVTLQDRERGREGEREREGEGERGGEEEGEAETEGVREVDDSKSACVRWRRRS
jgi:hypothetical protein